MARTQLFEWLTTWMMGTPTARSSLWMRSDFSQREALSGKVETTIVSYELCSNTSRTASNGLAFWCQEPTGEGIYA